MQACIQLYKEVCVCVCVEAFCVCGSLLGEVCAADDMKPMSGVRGRSVSTPNTALPEGGR